MKRTVDGLQRSNAPNYGIRLAAEPDVPNKLQSKR